MFVGTHIPVFVVIVRRVAVSQRNMLPFRDKIIHVYRCVMGHIWYQIVPVDLVYFSQAFILLNIHIELSYNSFFGVNKPVLLLCCEHDTAAYWL